MVCVSLGFKKESNEFSDVVEDCSQEPSTTEKEAIQGNEATRSTPAATRATQTTAEQSSQATTNETNKGKQLMDPPSTFMVLPTSSMVATTSSLAPTSSFVAESSLGRETWERRPLTRSVGKLAAITLNVYECLLFGSQTRTSAMLKIEITNAGFQYQTVIDALLVDVSQIDKFALNR